MADNKKPNADNKPNSEDELGKKWDRCLADFVVKLGEHSDLLILSVTKN